MENSCSLEWGLHIGKEAPYLHDWVSNKQRKTYPIFAQQCSRITSQLAQYCARFFHAYTKDSLFVTFSCINSHFLKLQVVSRIFEYHVST